MVELVVVVVSVLTKINHKTAKVKNLPCHRHYFCATAIKIVSTLWNDALLNMAISIVKHHHNVALTAQFSRNQDYTSHIDVIVQFWNSF